MAQKYRSSLFLQLQIPISSNGKNLTKQELRATVGKRHRNVRRTRGALRTEQARLKERNKAPNWKTDQPFRKIISLEELPYFVPYHDGNRDAKNGFNRKVLEDLLTTLIHGRHVVLLTIIQPCGPDQHRKDDHNRVNDAFDYVEPCLRAIQQPGDQVHMDISPMQKGERCNGGEQATKKEKKLSSYRDIFHNKRWNGQMGM